MSLPFDCERVAVGEFGGTTPTTCTFDEARVAILPVPLDLTASYVPGTRMGPYEILVASSHTLSHAKAFVRFASTRTSFHHWSNSQLARATSALHNCLLKPENKLPSTRCALSGRANCGPLA